MCDEDESGLCCIQQLLNLCHATNLIILVYPTFSSQVAPPPSPPPPPLLLLLHAVVNDAEPLSCIIIVTAHVQQCFPFFGSETNFVVPGGRADSSYVQLVHLLQAACMRTN